VVLAATTPREHVWIGSLGTLADAPVALNDPGTIVVGDVVGLSAAIAKQVAVAGSNTDELARQDGSDRDEPWPARRGA
jgi:siroheme synthase